MKLVEALDILECVREDIPLNDKDCQAIDTVSKHLNDTLAIWTDFIELTNELRGIAGSGHKIIMDNRLDENSMCFIGKQYQIGNNTNIWRIRNDRVKKSLEPSVKLELGARSKLKRKLSILLATDNWEKKLLSYVNCRSEI